jgi:phosphatidylserine/phosphatidylglycerophosphate/cardiolipin synthase-like enzyme
VSYLADAAARLAGSLPVAHLTRLADAYRLAEHFTDACAAKAESVVPAPHRPAVAGLNAVWKTSDDVPGAAIALAIEAVLAVRAMTDAPTVEVVVTGPDSPNAPVRLTSEVVRQLIDRSTRRVMLVSYAAYQMANVIDALDRAASRGVQVQLVLESAAKLDGGGGAHAYASHQIFEWPIDRRNPPDAKLHAKAVIVDSRDVLLTSANMTNAAYDKNIELGVLCRGGNVARQVQQHFDALIADGVLRKVVR